MLRCLKHVCHALFRFSIGKTCVHVNANRHMPYHIKPSRCTILISINCAFLLTLFTLLWGNHNYHQQFDPILCKGDYVRENRSALSFPGNHSTAPARDNDTEYLRNLAQNAPIINHYNFLYPINIEDACAKFKVDVFLPIHSAVNNFERRRKMRKACQGIYAGNRRNRAVLLFFVGLPHNSETSLDVQRELLKESEHHGDIIQLDIEDSYHNISLKALGVLKWISKYCNNSEFVLKTDDDIVVDTPKSVIALRSTRRKHPHFVMGHIRRVGGPRFLYGKYCVEKEDYPNSTYPPYVAGGAMGYPTSTALVLYQQALRLKRLWLDDVFISGLCTQKLGIPVIGASEFAYSHAYTE